MTDAASKINYGRGFAWNLGFNFFTKITFALVGIFIANKLGPGPVGIYALLTTIYAFAELMRDAGLKQAFYNDPGMTPGRHRTYGRLSVTSGITFGLVMLAFAYPVAIFYKLPEMTWCMSMAASAVALNSFSAIPAASILKAGRFRDMGLIESAATLLSAGTAILFVFLGYGLFALMMQLIVRSLVLFVLCQRLAPIQVRNHDREAVGPIMRLCVQLVTTDLLWMLYTIADMLIVPKRFGTVMNGNYSWAKRLIAMPAELIFSPLHRTIIVAVGHRAGDRTELGRAFSRSFGLAILLLFPLYASLAFFAGPLVHSILRPDFAPAATVLPIMCLTESARSLGAFAGTALVAAQRASLPMVAWIVPYPLAGALLWLNWNHLTLVTTAWCFAAGQLAVNIFMVVAAFVILKSWTLEKAKLGKAAGCTILTVCGAFAYSHLRISNWSMLISAIMLVPLFHLGMVGIVFARNPFAYMSPNGMRRLRGTL